MMIFCMLTSRYFRFDWWSPLFQNFLQSLRCCFIKIKGEILESQIVCHTFICLSQPRSLLNLLMETRDMPNELVLFYVVFLTVPLYIQWEQFIIVQVTLTTPSHWLPSNFMLVFKKVKSEPLEHCDFFDTQDHSWGSSYQTQNNLDYFQIKICQIQPSNRCL